VTAAFLTDGWFDALTRELPAASARGVADCSVEVTVLRAPGGDVAWHLSVADGGVVAAAGPLPGATVAVTLPYDDMVAVVRGELAPSVAFMQGRMKTAGDPGVLLDVLRATASPAFGAARDDLLASTEF
jgi:hypothetical protein